MRILTPCFRFANGLPRGSAQNYSGFFFVCLFFPPLSVSAASPQRRVEREQTRYHKLLERRHLRPRALARGQGRGSSAPTPDPRRACGALSAGPGPGGTQLPPAARSRLPSGEMRAAMRTWRVTAWHIHIPPPPHPALFGSTAAAPTPRHGRTPAPPPPTGSAACSLHRRCAPTRVCRAPRAAERTPALPGAPLAPPRAGRAARPNGGAERALAVSRGRRQRRGEGGPGRAGRSRHGGSRARPGCGARGGCCALLCSAVLSGPPLWRDTEPPRPAGSEPGTAVRAAFGCEWCNPNLVGFALLLEFLCLLTCMCHSGAFSLCWCGLMLNAVCGFGYHNAGRF